MIARAMLAALLCLMLAGCGESVAERRSNEGRDSEIKSQAREQMRMEERIDRLEDRVEKLERAAAQR